MTVLPNQSSVEDLSLSSSSDDPASGAVKPKAETFKPSRYVLPKDLDAAIKQLNDHELDRLVAAALEERNRRKRLSLPDNHDQRQDVEVPAKSLPQGKLDAMRAAFKAGVTPTRIAREFGISKADVRSALRSDARKQWA